MGSVLLGLAMSPAVQCDYKTSNNKFVLSAHLLLSIFLLFSLSLSLSLSLLSLSFSLFLSLLFSFSLSEVVGAVISVLIIWLVTGVLVYEAVLRIINKDKSIDADVMLITACLSVFVNVL